MNRRNFIKAMVFTGAGAFTKISILNADELESGMQEYGMLIDTVRCIGCYACVYSCQKKWGFEQRETDKLSATSNTAIKHYKDVNVPKLCMHCKNPTCVSVCPVGALKKTSSGAVIYDKDRCIGCRYCIQACPFQVPTYEWEKVNPIVRKCNFCYERITLGKPTVCAEACMPQARVFGPRKEIIKEAKDRIESDPDTYYNYIYGIKEVGGTSIIYLAQKPPKEIGLKTDLPQEPLPVLTWNVISKIPGFVMWSSVLLAGIWWITSDEKNNKTEVHK